MLAALTTIHLFLLVFLVVVFLVVVFLVVVVVVVVVFLFFSFKEQQARVNSKLLDYLWLSNCKKITRMLYHSNLFLLFNTSHLEW